MNRGNGSKRQKKYRFSLAFVFSFLGQNIADDVTKEDLRFRFSSSLPLSLTVIVCSFSAAQSIFRCTYNNKSL